MPSHISSRAMPKERSSSGCSADGSHVGGEMLAESSYGDVSRRHPAFKSHSQKEGTVTVVLVHGNPETDAIWGPLVDVLGHEDVVRLSPPGFGSPLPDD